MTASSLLSAREIVERLNLSLDPWQWDLLLSEHRRILLNVSRQGGKSTISALKALILAMQESNSLILIVSPGERQSKLLFKKLMRFYQDLGKPVPSKTENKLSLELVNGSEIHALPGEEGTIRGFSDVKLLLVDEASRVEDEMMAAVRPMLAVSGGQFVGMSTPWGKRGWWYEAWMSSEEAELRGEIPEWKRIRVRVYDIPRISAEFIAAEKKALPRTWFASEYETEFVEPDDAVFNYAAIAQAFAAEVEPLFPLKSGNGHRSLADLAEVEPW